MTCRPTDGSWRFTAGIAVLAGVLFGVLPALRSTRVSLTSAMKGAAETEHHGRPRATRWIVATQVALSLVLLVAAGLLLRSFAKLAMLDIGFDRRNVLLMDANIQAAEIPPEQRQVLYGEIEMRLRALPGVVAASRSWNTPVSGMEWNQFIQADTPNPPTGEASLAYFNSISPAYFETLGTPLLAGRAFNDQDTKAGPAVTIINQALAHKFYPGLNPVGRYFKIADVAGKPMISSKSLASSRIRNTNRFARRPSPQRFSRWPRECRAGWQEGKPSNCAPPRRLPRWHWPFRIRWRG